MKRELLVQNPRPDGYHLMLELYGCDMEKINSHRFLHRAVKTAVKNVGLTNLGSRYHRFQPQGVTGFTLLAQSHISLHTWPEYGYLVLDIFTCGDESQANQLEHHLLKRLGPCEVKRRVVRKGYQYHK
ncbi:MAG: adenosylmethionine decarboxylase [Deltaproteobacteria bacterium]|nr:adenosylmethionine decarboxylase [Deltaproteobacteria bacterium]MBW1951898.1 adenosylmethionine decarboxylase [Deltaproteobacteria bacterium]MBW1986960.1 adenosylmethionine decarboxylase [Deltaproteobacteria bacterium]MBW2134475.1 adenosylmethionine decarboxylase [Deltaproteobacteria bacterium]